MYKGRRDMADLHPALHLPSHVFGFFRGYVFSLYYPCRAIVLLESLVDDESPVTKVLRHRRTRIWRRVLNVRPVDIFPGKLEIGLDRFNGVVRIPYNQSANYIHDILMYVIDCFQGSITSFLSILTLRVLLACSQELQIIFQDVFDSQEYVAKACLAHERRKRVPVISNRGRHGLNRIVDIVESGIDDCLTQSFKAFHVQYNIVVHDKDCPGPAIVRITNVGNDTVKRISEKIPAAHFNYRTKTAVESAPARGLNYIDLTAEYGVTAQYSSASVWKLYFTIFQSIHRTIMCVIKTVAASIRKPLNMIKSVFVFYRPQKLAKGYLALAPDYEIHDTRGGIGVSIRCQAGIIPANRYPYVGFELSHQIDGPFCRPALECHYGQSDKIRIVFSHQLLNGLLDAILDQYQIGDSNFVVWVYIAGEGSKSTVRHSDSDRRHMLERVRHR